MKTQIQFKRAVLIIAQWLITTAVFAQTQDWLWAKREGTVNYDAGNSVTTDAGGNVYVAGTFGDQILTKYDSVGNAIWSVSASATPYGVTTDLAGNAYLAGYIDSSATFENITLISAGEEDVFIAKFNSSGHVLWAKSAGGTADDFSLQTAVDADGNVYITGDFSSPSITFGNITLTNAGESDFFIARYDSSGNVMWAKKAGGTESEGGHAIAVDALGKVYVSGVFTSPSITFGTIKLRNTGGIETADIFLTKYDVAGNVIWAKKEGGTYDDYVSAVTVDPSGNVFIAGSFQSPSISFGQYTFTNPNENGLVYLTKFTGTGNVLWATIGEGDYYDNANAVDADADGNIYITGFFESSSITFGNVTLTNNSDLFWGDLFLTKYDASGNVLWATKAGGSRQDDGSAVNIDANGNSYVVGSFYSPSLAFGNITLFNSGVSDGFIAKYGENKCNHTFYADADGDGFGNDNITTQACNPPAGYAYNNADCNDADASVNPAANELCGNTIDDNCNGLIDENSVSASISPMGTVEICKGSIEILTANSSTGISYQWLKNANEISGATQQMYSATKSGDYSVRESNAFSCSSTSLSTTVHVNSVADAVITPLGDLDICQTGSVVLQANAGVGYTYQWRKGSSIILGATNQNYTATKKGTYKVDVINSSGCGKTSKGVKVTKSCREENVSIDVIPQDVLKLYPNPTKGNFTISFITADESITEAKVKVMNLIGQVVYDQNVSLSGGELKKEIFLDPSSPQGMYLVQVMVNDKVYSHQLVYHK